MPQQRSTARDRRPVAGNRRPPRSAARRKRDRRREALRQRSVASPGWRRFLMPGAAAGAVIVLAIVLAVVLTRGHGSGSHSHATPAPTPTPPALATLTSAAGGEPVDGVSCDTTQATTHRISAHLAVYVDGGARQIPAGIGVGPPRQTASTDAGPFVSGKCYYWVNTRTGDGLVHIQPPTPAAYTLGTLFDIWGQPLSGNQVGPASGAVIVLVNGSQYSGDPRAVPLTAHAVIQLNVGTPVPFHPYTFPAGQ